MGHNKIPGTRICPCHLRRPNSIVISGLYIQFLPINPFFRLLATALGVIFLMPAKLVAGFTSLSCSSLTFLMFSNALVFIKTAWHFEQDNIQIAGDRINRIQVWPFSAIFSVFRPQELHLLGTLCSICIGISGFLHSLNPTSFGSPALASRFVQPFGCSHSWPFSTLAWFWHCYLPLIF